MHDVRAIHFQCQRQIDTYLNLETAAATAKVNKCVLLVTSPNRYTFCGPEKQTNKQTERKSHRITKFILASVCLSISIAVERQKTKKTGGRLFESSQTGK